MSIIIVPPPTPPTQAQRLASTVQQQQQQMRQLWQQIQSTMTNISNFIYNCQMKDDNGVPFTAQAVFDAYGNNGGDLCVLCSAVKTMIGDYLGPQNAPVVPPAGFSLQINTDGTVSVTATPSKPEVPMVKPNEKK